MGLDSTTDSDNAANFWFNIEKAIDQLMLKHVHKENNQFNTPGYIDCALIIRDLSTARGLGFYPTDFKVLPIIKKKFEKDAKNWTKNSVELGDEIPYKSYMKLKQFIDSL